MQSSHTVPLLLLIPAFLNAGSTNVTLTSSANPAVYGHAVTLTAVVSPSSATGTVTFYDGVSVLETEPLSNGTANFATVLLDFGANSLTAYYGGDTNDAPSKSAALVQMVNAAADTGFQAAVGSAGGGGLLAVAVGDFNGDGKADLATIGSVLNVLLGNGDGTFQPLSGYAVANNQNASIAVGDFNGDGIPDLATPTSLEGIAVLLGHGDGTFQTASYWYSGGYPNSVVVADFNGDGKADLAFGDFNDGVVTLLGNGDGTFTQSFRYAAPSDPVIAVGDFNGDGKPDLAFSNQVSGFAGVLLGNGDGIFQAGGLYTDGTNLNGWASVAVGDFNGDGKADLAVIESGSNTVNVFLGNGDGTLQPPVSYATGTKPICVAVGDFNGDGKPDLAVVNHSSNNISVLLGNGDGTFQAAVEYSAGVPLEYAAVADFNGDGIADLAAVSETGTTTLEMLLALGPINTTTTLASSPNPSTYGQSVTLTATVAPATVTGTVTFNHGSTSLGTGQLSGGVATLTTAKLTAGSHSLTANYAGGAGVNGSTSPAIVQVVGKAATTTTLTSSPNPSDFHQNVTLTATVSPSTATGIVTFYHGTTSLGTGPLKGGVATLALATLSLGAHSLTAIYGGDANDTGSTSPPLIQVVQNATTTVLTSSPNPSVSGQKVILTATVTPSTATGTVTFYHGSTVFGTGTLIGGIATYKTTTLSVGTHALTASYGGDANDAASTSAAIYQVVSK
jgi:hypothetical protein